MPATTAFEERVAAWESEFLSAEAARSYPARRAVEEPDSPLRTPFQRDRDRIVHSKSFRRLKHKTQVFVAPEGDHYRTRLTHTLEACGIARTVARALGLNEDLTEAIGLGHDLGHPPFGHAGEAALDAALRDRCGAGFKHNEHSLRVVEVLERDGQGLNLTEQVRDGILKHTGSEKPASLEGRVVKLVDRVYLGPATAPEHEKVERTMRALFDHYLDHPGEIPALEPGADDCQRVADYIAGMTDRFCIAKFTELTIPEEARF